MEFFGASEKTPLDYCLEQINHCELVICVLGVRYGTRPPQSEKSYTHHEIEHAMARKIPILPYFLDDDKQLVLAKHVANDSDRKALAELKDLLSINRTVARFTNPDNLAMMITADLSNRPSRQDAAARRYRECAYDAMAEWYDIWYEDHWLNDEPYNTICSIARNYKDASRGSIVNMKILDCDCGTGNTYATFKKNGYTIFGTDGSREMLQRAVSNCEEKRISPDNIIRVPINWSDLDSYLRHFDEGSFDIIVNTANSFCHIPPIPEYMNRALTNFHRLLKPGGLLIIDTKKYIHDSRFNEPKRYVELQYATPEQEWVVRTERVDSRKSSGGSNIHFHTRILHDRDPSFNDVVMRSLIVVTIFGDNLSPRTLVVPYYPLPAKILGTKMTEAGFVSTQQPAKTGMAINWKYDIVVGQKP